MEDNRETDFYDFLTNLFILLAALDLDSMRGSLHILVSHTLSEGPEHHKVGLAGLIPGGHLRGELGVHEAMSC